MVESDYDLLKDLSNDVTSIRGVVIDLSNIMSLVIYSRLSS